MTAEVGSNDAAKGKDRNLPPLLAELQKKYPDEGSIDNGDSGTFYVGEKGILYTGTYGKYMHILPMEKMDADARAAPHPAAAQEHVDRFPRRLPRGQEGDRRAASSTAPG